MVHTQLTDTETRGSANCNGSVHVLHIRPYFCDAVHDAEWNISLWLSSFLCPFGLFEQPAAGDGCTSVLAGHPEVNHSTFGPVEHGRRSEVSRHRTDQTIGVPGLSLGGDVCVPTWLLPVCNKLC